MADPFQTVILKMREFGFFQFLFPFMLSAAVFYGLLRKSQVFGKPDENISVNATVALVASFMVWSYPILAGVNVETQLSTFFMHGMTATLVILIGILISSMFFKPDLPDQLSSILKTGRGAGIVLVAGVIIGGGVLFSSGLINVLKPTWIASETLSTIGVIFLLLITVLIIVVPGGKGEE